MAYFCSCHKLQSYHQYLAIAIQLIVASAHPAIVQAGSTTDDFCGSRFTGMLIMRMYALYERRRACAGPVSRRRAGGVGHWLGALSSSAFD